MVTGLAVLGIETTGFLILAVVLAKTLVELVLILAVGVVLLATVLTTEPTLVLTALVALDFVVLAVIAFVILALVVATGFLTEVDLLPSDTETAKAVGFLNRVEILSFTIFIFTRSHGIHWNPELKLESRTCSGNS